MPFHSIFSVFHTDYERDDMAPSQSPPQNDIWAQCFTDNPHASYQPTPNTISHSLHHYSTPMVPTQSHYPPVDSSTSETPNRQELLARAFRPSSIFPSEACARLFGLITQSHFIKAHQLEPSIDSSEGQALLKNVWNLSDCPPMASQKSNLSIFALLVDLNARRCLICGSTKISLDRAIGCVRSHLDHRPFVCGGEPAGCARCKDYAR